MFTGKSFIIIVLSLLLFAAPVPGALACSTCGCSELCPLVMIEDTESNHRGKGLLSESIWGSIILKMAYQRDPQIQKLTRHIKGVNALTGTSILGAIGGTFAQNIISVGTLNPPEGQKDSYLPGGIGVGLSGLINVAFDGSMLANWALRKKVKARQLVIQEHVESVLNHLEHSEASCPNAQSELAQIIGERAASDCIRLWKSSHAVATADHKDQVSLEQDSAKPAKDLVSFASKDELSILIAWAY